MKEEPRRIPVGEFTTIYRRGKKGIYTADFSYRSSHGRRSLRTTNFRVARRRAMELERKILDGRLEIREGMRPEGNAPPETILQASEEFLSYLETEERRSKTLQKYRGILVNFAGFAELRKVVRLADVDMRLIDQFRAFRKPLIGRKSMHHEGVLLKGFLEWCRQRKLISENPLRDTKFKRPNPPRRGGPTLQQIDAILRLADERRRPILAMLAFTGMRSGECRHIQLADVDQQGNWIKIESRKGYETKTGESRKVPIHPRLRTYLKGLTRRERQWFFTSPATPKYPDGDHFLNTKKLNEYFLDLLKKLGSRQGANAASPCTRFATRSRRFASTLGSHARLLMRGKVTVRTVRPEVHITG